MKRVTVLLWVLVVNVIASQALFAQWRAGFFTVGMGQPISQVPWSKLTHLTLCCAAADVNGQVSKNWLDPSSYPEVLSTAHANNVKVILSLGGSTTLLNSNTAPNTIATFVNNITAYINNNGFDGVDLDWETSIDVSQYADLVSRLRSAMPNKLITVDTGDWDNLVQLSVAVYSKVDRLNVMCYDMAAGAGM
ncbi:MAG TPA: glycoside hydrolase family 18 protein, partial [Bryobacteraceae bacterium]|nr:glycoside hydrolase family 18 protein [Bryobacteraceae bacterium]